MDKDQEQEMLEQDREELIAVLHIRFQEVPEEIRDKIGQIEQLDVLQRLILVAANAANWEVFQEELQEGETAFRLLGERFDPVERKI